MKTPWNNLLLQYGTAVAALIVITLCGAILMIVVAAAVVLTEVAQFIK